MAQERAVGPMSAEPLRPTSEFDSRSEAVGDEPEGAGWLLFAGIMVIVAGVLNTIWGIAAISNSKFFTQNATYILTELKTWGWVVLIIGIAQLIAAFSIWAGGQYGRWIGIITAGLNAIVALLSIPAYPLWALCLFGVDILIIYGLAAYGGQRMSTV